MEPIFYFTSKINILMSQKKFVNRACSDGWVQMVGFPVVEQPTQVQVLDLAWAFVFTWIYLGSLDVILSVIGDVPVNSEAHVMTSSTSRSASSVLRRCS
jgi:hypothetical protein